jgi:transcriptional regulator with XRE-family HTH domain
VDNEYRFLKRFGQRLAAHRLKSGLTQEKVAELAKLDRSYISLVETGRRNPSIGTLRRIAKMIGVSLAELFRPF